MDSALSSRTVADAAGAAAPVGMGGIGAQLRRRAAAETRGGLLWLLLPSAVLLVSVAVSVPMWTKLAWDETVYVSQVSSRVPTEFFSAPRAIGTSWLVAPVAAFTTSPTAFRCYLAVVAALGLFLALLCWRRLRGPRTLALAGSLFATLWVASFYATQVMPNLWIALAGLAALGSFLTAATDRTARWPLPALVLSLAVAALMRPSDAAYIALPMLVASLAVRRWRRPLLVAALVGGLVLGGLDWIVEAYLNYGGPTHRLHRASQIEGGMGLHLAAGYALHSLDGPTLCRPCTTTWHHKMLSLWWLALPALVVAGVYVRSRRRRIGTGLMAALCGLSVAFPYLFMIGYSAPRFFLPAYALLSVPVADLVMWMAAGARPSWRRWTLPVVVLAVAAQLISQNVTLVVEAHRAPAERATFAHAAHQLERLGLTGGRDCLLVGSSAQPVGFYLNCQSADIMGSHNGTMTGAQVRAAARTRHVGVLLNAGQKRPAYAHGWPMYVLHHHSHGYRVLLAPPPS